MRFMPTLLGLLAASLVFCALPSASAESVCLASSSPVTDPVFLQVGACAAAGASDAGPAPTASASSDASAGAALPSPLPDVCSTPVGGCSGGVDIIGVRYHCWHTFDGYFDTLHCTDLWTGMTLV